MRGSKAFVIADVEFGLMIKIVCLAMVQPGGLRYAKGRLD